MANPTVKRRARQRRVFRLAALLTGNLPAAERVVEAVQQAQPDLPRLDNAHLDRLTILRCREIEPPAAPAAGTDGAAGTGTPVAGTLAALSGQAREAWVLSRAYRLPLREVARAMDCSVTATRRHLGRADAAMAALDPDPAPAVASLLEWSASLDLPRTFVARLERRMQRRRVLWLVGLAALILAAMWVVHLLSWRGP